MMQTDKKTPIGWKETTLGKVAEIIGGGTPKTEISEYWNGEIPWLSVVDFNNDHRWVGKTEKTITKKGLENSSTNLLNTGDLIISARGTVGAFAQLKIPMTFNQSCYGLRSKECTTNDFLFCLLKQNNQQFKKNVHGAVFDTITRDTFDQIDILLPPLPEQKAIAAVLSSLDDKIELLLRQNKTLENIAQTIFKEWFVNFTTDGKKVKINGKTGLPEGWSQKGLDEIADFLNGSALQKYPPKNEADVLPVIKIRELKAGITEQTDKASKQIDAKYIVEDGDVLFSWSGSLDVTLWCYGKGALNQHLFKVTSKKYPKWFYYYWILEHLPFFRSIAKAKATTMGHIQRHHLAEALVTVPDDDFMVFANNKIEPVFEHIISNNSQIQTLLKLRDTLLPKLLSGEIGINKRRSM